ncbi:MAG: nucleotidyltransferase domain-containing protein [Bacteroidota bacterium]
MALPDHLPPAVRAAVTEAKARLAETYGARLERVVLYGSHARGDAHEDSDVDLLVVLRGKVRPLAEIRRLGPLALDLVLRHGELVSFHPRTVAEVEAAPAPFLRRVRAEGVPV